MIAYVFPPLGGGGVHRTLGFARHLPACGWRPIVVCADESSGYWARDASLTPMIPPEVEVHRVPEGRVEQTNRVLTKVLRGPIRRAYRRNVLMPDPYITWFGPALSAARAVIEKRRPDVLYSTGGPWTNHLIALALARQFDLPWVADFRDPWTQSELFSPPTPLHRELYKWLEGQIYQRANAVISNTSYNLERLQRDFPVTRGKSVCIPNGFDEEMFEGVQEHPKTSNEVVLAYAGSLYPGRDGMGFFNALEKVLCSDEGLAKVFRLRLYGKVDDTLKSLPPKVRSITEAMGYLPQVEVNQALAQADAVLMTMPQTQGPVGFIPGKLYSLLRLGKPLLAPCGPGPARDLIEASDLDALVMDVDREAAVAQLGAWLNKLKAGSLQTRWGGANNAKDYDRRNLTSELAAMLATLL